MNDLIKQISDFCIEYDMLPEGSRVLVGVSGGSDSMCLLDALTRISREFGVSVSAAHYNHRLRGAESDGDESFVADWCENHCIPIYIGSGDVAGESKRRGRGTEETAREMRYAFFRELAAEFGFTKIATAHNADDNLETLLFRIARGSGLRGLCGIPPVRGNIIRPLLSVPRETIERYNIENNIPHREDSTNAKSEYARNKLRHHAVPVLREINPNVSETSSRTLALLRQDEEFLSSLAEKFVSENFSDGGVGIDSLLALPMPVLSRALRILCGGVTPMEIADIINLAKSGSPSARLSVPGMSVKREYDRLVFGENNTADLPTLSLSAGKMVEISSLGLRITVSEVACVREIYKSLTTFLFKSANICGIITVRSRKTGDTIRLSENSGTKTLKKLFIEKRVPKDKRGSVPVFCDDNGVLAVRGIGSDIRTYCKPGDRAIMIKTEEIENDRTGY